MIATPFLLIGGIIFTLWRSTKSSGK